MGEFLTSICFLPVVYVFSHAQGARQEGAAARTACATILSTTARSVGTPTRLPREAMPIVSVDSSDASGDDGLHQRIAELKEQY